MTDKDEPLLTPLQRAYLEANPEASLTESAKEEATSQPRKLAGVEGWLYFFGISLFALGPLLTVVMTAAEFSNLKVLYPDAVGSSQWNSAVAAGWIATGIYCAISMFAGWRIFKRLVPSTIPIVIACIWFMGPGLGVIGLMVAQDISGGANTAADAGAAFGRPLVYCIIWTIYLLRSKRVKNTYRGVSIAAPWSERLNRPARQVIFFSLCWVVLSFSYFTFVSPPDTYADDAPNMWAIILLPPLVIGAGAWVYRKFVGSSTP
jgi:Protein of unknown function (DUF2569)